MSKTRKVNATATENVAMQMVLTECINTIAEFIYGTFDGTNKLTLKEAKSIYKIMAFLQDNYEGEDPLVEQALHFFTKSAKEALELKEPSLMTEDFYHYLLFLQRNLGETK